MESSRKVVYLLILLHHPELLRLHTLPPRGNPITHIPLHQSVARVARIESSCMRVLHWPGIPDTASHNRWADGGQLPLQKVLDVRMEAVSRNLIVQHEVDGWWDVGEQRLS